MYMISNLERMPVTDSDVRRETRNDPKLGKVFSMLQTNRWLTDDPDLAPFVSRRNELSLWNGCIMWGSRVVMPTKLQSLILEELHAAHLGIVKMKAKSLLLLLLLLFLFRAFKHPTSFYWSYLL